MKSRMNVVIGLSLIHCVTFKSQEQRFWQINPIMMLLAAKIPHSGVSVSIIPGFRMFRSITRSGYNKLIKYLHRTMENGNHGSVSRTTQPYSVLRAKSWSLRWNKRCIFSIRRRRLHLLAASAGRARCGSGSLGLHHQLVLRTDTDSLPSSEPKEAKVASREEKLWVQVGEVGV